MHYAEKMVSSVDQVDKRLINLYIYRKAAQKKIRFGLSNNILLSENRKLNQQRGDEEM